MRKYTYIFVAAIVSMLCACSENESFNPDSNALAGRGIQIVGAAEDFDKKNVNTRADGEVSDSYITEMTMFIFKQNGDMVQGYNANQEPISSAVNIQKPNPTFLIETSRYNGTGIIASMDGDQSQMKYYKNTETDLGACSIYIVANAYSQLVEKGLLDGNASNGEITSLATLQAALLDVDATLDMPKDENGNYIGFPMIGTHSNGITFNLGYNGGQTNSSVATIPLKKLYSKIRFRMQVNSNQVVVGGPTPKFKLDKVEVFNVPTKVRMGYQSGDYLGNIGDALTYQFRYTGNENADRPFTITEFDKTVINHSSSATTTDYLEFGFYMPEHKVTPTGNFDYPSTWGDMEVKENNDKYKDYKQYYKPNGVSNQIATFVRIYGSYTDHNGQIKAVEYDIYLGQDNAINFEIKRNQQLNNYLTITGLTNHKDAYGGTDGNISIDHRVTVEDKGYNLSMEREAILDAHFEVRPIDIELQKGASMTIAIPSEYRNWIAMESDAIARSGANPSLYVNTSDERKGVRKYFTTNLVSELTNANQSSITVKHSGKTANTEIHRIWFYIDENPNVYDKTGTGKQTSETGDHTVSKTQYRNAKVNFYYSGDGTPDASETATPASVINFQQWNLWRVWNSAGNRYYDIEHEEEYLNNYASDQGYGQTQDGMPWGLEGVKLSNSRKAAYIDANNGLLGAIIDAFGGSYDSWINSMIDKSGLAPFYDFYLERDERPKNVGFRNYSGKVFNAEIISTLNTLYETSTDVNYKKKVQVEGLILTDTPSSAIAYCYHKNKRNEQGNVSLANWYLPSIDEIEEISIGAYDEFDRVFQNQKYWSCQPSAFNKTLRVEREKLGGWLGTEVQNGQYMDDNENRARATSVKYDPSNPNANKDGYVNISSGVNGIEGTWTLHFEWLGDFVQNQSGYQKNNGSNQTNYLNPNHDGNLLRTTNGRIRAVYRSGTGNGPKRN